MNRTEVDTRERFAAVDTRISDNARRMVPLDVYEERHGNLRARIATLEDSAERALIYRRNLTVAVVGAIVASIGAVVASLLAVNVH